jgi:hypothetical protein
MGLTIDERAPQASPEHPTREVAGETRAILTRDLLLRAGRAAPGESRALQFRALHLNLSLVRELIDDLGLPAADREALEHRALDGLLLAVRIFDPAGEEDFAAFATPVIGRLVADDPSLSRRSAPASLR